MENKRILVVDDDLVLLETLHGILEGNGYHCLACDEAEKAIELVEKFRPDLILLDYMLPGWNGGELCLAIRGIDGFEHIPILIMSGYTGIISSMEEYGCNAVLEKPFKIDTLLETIAQLISDAPSDGGLMIRVLKILRKFVGKHS